VQVEKNVYVTVDDEELEALQVDSSHTIEIDKLFLSQTSTSDTSTPPTTSFQMTKSARMPSPSSAMQ
jgi:hypothetical protein